MNASHISLTDSRLKGAGWFTQIHLYRLSMVLLCCACALPHLRMRDVVFSWHGQMHALFMGAALGIMWWRSRAKDFLPTWRTLAAGVCVMLFTLAPAAGDFRQGLWHALAIALAVGVRRHAGFTGMAILGALSSGYFETWVTYPLTLCVGEKYASGTAASLWILLLSPGLYVEYRFGKSAENRTSSSPARKQWQMVILICAAILSLCAPLFQEKESADSADFFYLPTSDVTQSRAGKSHIFTFQVHAATKLTQAAYSEMSRAGDQRALQLKITSTQDGSTWTNHSQWFWSALRHPLNGPWHFQITHTSPL